ncbi:MAG: branched-chain amino acid ABC transporter permease [Mycobacteriales bacterium]
MAALTNFLITGIASGAVFALLSIGIILIYRVSRVINLAHGAVGVFATYVFYFTFVQRLHLPVAVAFLLTLLVGGVLGAAMQVLFINPVRTEGQLTTLIMSIGVLLLLTDGAIQLYGPTQPAIPSIFSDRTITIGGSGITVHQLATIGLVLLLAGGLSVLLTRSAYGKAIEAIAQDPGAARLIGVPVTTVTTGVWAAGGATAALAGMLFIHLNTIDPLGLTFVLISGLVAAVLGGLTSLPLAVAGSFGLGMVFSVAQGYITSAGVGNAFVFGLLLIFLLVSPRLSRATGTLAEI